MKNEGLWLVAGVIVVWWWMKNNGRGFNPTNASGELTGNPNPVYGGNPVQTISGTWHL